MPEFAVKVAETVPGGNGQGIWQIVLNYIIPPNFYGVKYLVKGAEQMISNYWEIAALNPTSNKIIFMGKLQL